jgi:hypothetical protein
MATPEPQQTPSVDRSCASLIDFTYHLNGAGQILSDIPSLQGLNATKFSYSATGLLSKKSGYYIVPYLGKFYYIPYKGITSLNEHLFKMPIQRPAVLREGIVVLESVPYYVTYDDLARGIVRKARKLTLKRGPISYVDFISGNYSPAVKTAGADPDTQQPEEGAPTSVSAETFVDKTSKSNHLAGLTDNFDVAESEAADMAFHKQIGSLLDSTYSKEGNGWGEWEIAEDPQPG